MLFPKCREIFTCLQNQKYKRQLHVILCRVLKYSKSQRDINLPDEKDVQNFGNTVSNCHSINFDDSYIYDRISLLLERKIGKNLSIFCITLYLNAKIISELIKTRHLFIHFSITSYLVISDTLLYFYVTYVFEYILANLSNEIEFQDVFEL